MNTLTPTTHSPSDEQQSSAAVRRLPSAVLLFLGALCYYAALPPLNIAPLALAVPILWGLVIRRPEPVKWYWVFLASYLFWLASIWWIACPHPLTALGLLGLAAYLSVYWVLFFAATRVAVHRFRLPLLVAMPVCWIGTEYWRCHVMFGGFSFCSLEHAFYLYPSLIQFASVGGSLLVGGIIMFIGAAFVTIFYIPKLHLKICYFVFFFVPALFFLCAVSVIRAVELGMPGDDSSSTAYRIVALQGNRQVRLDDTQEDLEKTFRQFIDLTHQTISERLQRGESLPDLIIWPETVCYRPAFAFEGTLQPAVNEENIPIWELDFREFVDEIGVPVIFGLSTFVFEDDPDRPRRLNSALLVQPQRGEELGRMYRYDKMHLVMFGEYIPFADFLPEDFILRTLCPEAHPGSKPVAFPIENRSAGQGSERVMASVNICFESTIAPLVRRNVLTLREQGYDPRILINMSNVGWFWFSQQIEQHLATHVFRAVENRMWYVTATNGGFSAIIDPTGRIRKIGERGEAEAVEGLVWWYVGEEQQATFYQKFGDWYALLFAIVTLGLAGFAWWERRKNKSKNKGVRSRKK